MGNLGTTDNGRDQSIIEARFWLVRLGQDGGDEEQDRNVAVICNSLEELLGYRRRIFPEHIAVPASVAQAEDWALRITAELDESRQALGLGAEMVRPELNEDEAERWTGRIRRRIQHLATRLRYLNGKIDALRKQEREERERQERQADAQKVVANLNPSALLGQLEDVTTGILDDLEVQRGPNARRNVLNPERLEILTRVRSALRTLRRVDATRLAPVKG